MIHYVKFGNARISYGIIKSPSRKRTEIVIADKKLVNVLAPENKSVSEIRKIVKTNLRWIYRKQLSLGEKQINILTYKDGSKLPYLGRYYSLSIRIGNKASSLEFHKGKFIANLDTKNSDSTKFLYEGWLEKQGYRVLNRMVGKYSKMTGIDYNSLKLRIKSQRNRVGSLGRNLTLNFNKKILSLPIKIIEYIVVHELCHVLIPTHSKKYWQLVEKIISDYRKRKEWLEKNNKVIL